jgi:uncharacterized protein
MARPTPTITPMMAPFYDAAKRGELVVPECDACHQRHYEPEAVCPHCLSSWHWAKSDGTGTLYSFSVVHRGATPAFEVPYTLALIEMDDGWIMMSNLLGTDGMEPQIGMRVQVEFVGGDDGVTLPYFRPVASQ